MAHVHAAFAVHNRLGGGVLLCGSPIQCHAQTIGRAFLVHKPREDLEPSLGVLLVIHKSLFPQEVQQNLQFHKAPSHPSLGASEPVVDGSNRLPKALRKLPKFAPAIVPCVC